MATLKEQFAELFRQAFVEQGLSSDWGVISWSDRPDLGCFQCNGALGAAKSLKKNPRELAQLIVASVENKIAQWKFSDSAPAATLSIAGPGFININPDPAWIALQVDTLSQDSRFGISPVAHPRTVVIDYGGPNVAKSLHAGHLRSPIIGEVLMRIHRFAGDRAIGDNHLGDWGTPMGMLIAALQESHPTLPYFDPQFSGQYPSESPVTTQDLETLYPAASARYKTDPNFANRVLKATDELQKGHVGYRALWNHFVKSTISDLESGFAHLNIHFDHWLGESFYEDKMPKMIERLKAQGMTEVSEGALVIPVANAETPDAPPLILIKSGGGYLYHTSDLATVEYRVEHFGADLILYVVDKRQSLHFKQVFEAAKKTGLSKNAVMIHTAFGTMNGKDGKPFKTRDGGTIKLKEIINLVETEARKRLTELGVSQTYSPEELDRIAHQVGIATLKYADLKNNRSADYIFDLERFSQFEGNTGPYLQYAAVRIGSMLKKASEQKLAGGPVLPPTCAAEKNLHLEFFKFADAFWRTYELSEPHHLCDYGFALAQAFNSFYKECHILSSTDSAQQSSWLTLVAMTRAQLLKIMDLLAIDVPERM